MRVHTELGKYHIYPLHFYPDFIKQGSEIPYGSTLVMHLDSPFFQ